MSKKIGTGVPTKTGGGFPAEGRKGGIEGAGERKENNNGSTSERPSGTGSVALVLQQHGELLVARSFRFLASEAAGLDWKD